MRQHPPAAEFRRVARLPGVQKHESDGEVLGESDRRLERQVRLIVRGQQRSRAIRGSLRKEVEMRFETVIAQRLRFIFIDVDLK